MATIGEKMTAVANAIRTKTGGTDKLTLDQMASSLNGIDNRDSSSLTASGATVSVPAGNYKTDSSKSVATATQATPSISVSSAGLITASAAQSAGYVAAGTKSATKQLTTKAATTITPSTSNQTAVASGVYTTGAITVKGDSNLKAENIKSGVSIFGVTGSSSGLNFSVVGGTSQPSNPSNNTIWVNTGNTITSWVFSHNQPNSPTEGMVWIVNGVSGINEFNAVSDVNLRVQVASVKQYISGSWVIKTTKVYQNGVWHETILYLYNNGYNNTSVTGGWTTTRYNYSSDVGNQGTPTITYNAANIKYVSNQNQHCIFNTVQKVDLTPYKTLKATISKCILGNGNSRMNLSVKNAPNCYYWTYVASTSISGANTYSVNIESLSGEYYIVFNSYSGSEVYITQIYLE